MGGLLLFAVVVCLLAFWNCVIGCLYKDMNYCCVDVIFVCVSKKKQKKNNMTCAILV